jgi:CRP-like cAMP-binding protein
MKPVRGAQQAIAPYVIERGDPDRDRAFERDAHAALHDGGFGRLEDEHLAALIRLGVHLAVPAFSTLQVMGEKTPRLFLIVTGVVRAYRSAPDGREFTVRYGYRGDVLGLTGLYSGELAADLQAATDATVCVFAPEPVRDFSERDPAFATAIAADLARAVTIAVNEATLHVFGSLREKVEHHLLDLACGQRRPGHAVVVTHQQLADATGAARESVSRVLRELRSEGLIETSRRGVTLLDPVRLHRLSPALHPRPGDR